MYWSHTIDDNTRSSWQLACILMAVKKTVPSMDLSCLLHYLYRINYIMLCRKTLLYYVQITVWRILICLHLIYHSSGLKNSNKSNICLQIYFWQQITLQKQTIFKPLPWFCLDFKLNYQLKPHVALVFLTANFRLELEVLSSIVFG